MHEEGLEEVVKGSWGRRLRGDFMSKIIGCQEEIKAWRRFVRNRSREDISLSKSKLEDLRCSDDEKRV